MNILLFCSILLFMIGGLLWYRQSYNFSFFTILGGGILVAIHSIFLDDYLHPWDERYHAVVALNAMTDPFHLKLMPTNYITSWPYQAWYATYTWLHKQPLFTWQMALGMKVFGTSLQGMRSASVVMFLVMGLAVYKATKLYFPKASHWLMLIVFTSPMLLLLVNGRQGMDHNDLAFASYTSLAFWAFLSYTKVPQLKYAIAIGLACGAAMLTKWLAGSLVLFSFGLFLLLTKNFTLKSWRDLFLSGLSSLLVFVPWQLYSYLRFPDLFIKEWEYNSLHFSHTVEEHYHAWNYHFVVWAEQFLILVLLALGTLSIARSLRREHRPILITAAVSFFAVLIFYTIAATKLKAFTIILIPYAAFLAAPFIEWLWAARKRKFVFLLIVAIISIKFFVTYVNESEPQLTIERSEKYREFALEVKNNIPENSVIFNTPSMLFADMIFYTHSTAYDRLPTLDEVELLQSLDKTICILVAPNQQIDSSLSSRSILIPADSIHFFYPQN
ncbi:ArnT family glycosyltransferase [Owenweeksia hongkongensis]|uniref:ArnT family glycosyltransferase n=1 Tax=Owenweeksia hongkongensis TaxID=253245 RepID=UPI003A8FF9C1